VQEEIKPVRDEIESFKPHVVYTLLEEFHYASAYDQHIAKLFELMKIPYTGATRAACSWRAARICPKRWCTIAGSRYRPLRVFRCAASQPALAPCPAADRKSLSEDGSFGISQASIVDTTRSSPSASPSFTIGSGPRHRRTVH